MNERLISRVALALTAITGFILAGWILMAPRSFYDDFPSFGRHWISLDGPYNEHLLRDYGAATLGLSVLAVCAFIWLTRPLVVAAGLAIVAAGVPHFAYHLANRDPYETGDQVGILASLALPPILGVVLVVMGLRLGLKPETGRAIIPSSATKSSSSSNM
jgi:hypothetical protein